MKISLQWINEFVDIADMLVKPSELGDLLTKAGLEVEDVIDRRRQYDQVVVGLILEKGVHPNADRLTLCQVTTGEGVIHEIVCGAKNHQAGDRVVVALPGAVLPGDFAIKQSTIRGVESGGMLCSNQELGLPATEGEGIVILPKEAQIGQAFADYAGLGDVIFELKVTPNRADCLSHYGLAREVAGILGRELKKLPELSAGEKSITQMVSVDVVDPVLCPRYVGRVVQNVQVAPSPDWLKRRLEGVGMNSINNIVDITNYVMLELGQPLHAFDLARIHGQIIVAKSVAGETFRKLDGTEIKLKGEELTIRDAAGPLALAGVVGGINSGVTESTQNVFIESASFLPMSVRKTSRSHGIETDSAYRFSRGVDPAMARVALDRAADLMVQLAGGKISSVCGDTRPETPLRPKVAVSIDLVAQRLGYAVPAAKFTDLMTRLGCQVEDMGGGQLQILPPSFRFDLEQEMDFVEEYARLDGYDRIPESLPAFVREPTNHDEKVTSQRYVHTTLRQQGYLQAVNYGFVGAKAISEFIGSPRGLVAAGLPVSDQPVILRNPLNGETDQMRSLLCFGLIENVLSNWRAGNQEGGLYEIGPVFFKTDAEYSETSRLALVRWGQPRGLWNKGSAHPSLYDIKGAVESLLETLRIKSYEWVHLDDKKLIPQFCHLGQFAQLKVEGQTVGFIGTLHPLLRESKKLLTDVALAEFDLPQLVKSGPRAWRAEALSRFPAVERDLAFLMPAKMAVKEVEDVLRQNGGELLRSIEVFDVYEGDRLPKGQKSVAFRLSLQDHNATLQDAQIQELQQKLVLAVTQQLPVSTR